VLRQVSIWTAATSETITTASVREHDHGTPAPADQTVSVRSAAWLSEELRPSGTIILL
jgi:hypothetical protein